MDRMYTDYTVDDILENVSYLEKDGTFEANIVSWISTAADYFRLMDREFEHAEVEKFIELQIEAEHQKEDALIADINKKKTRVENLESIVRKLKDLKLMKENECADLEATIESRKNIIQSDLERREKINRKKDQIITYKVLTHIDFLYNTRKVTGMVTKDDPVPFNFNPQVMTCEEITEKLWDLVLDKKSPEDYRDNSSIKQE